MPLRHGWIEVPRRKDTPEKVRDENEMLERLVRAGGDLFELQEKESLYPFLLKAVKNGETKTAEGIVKTLAAAFDKYAAIQPPPSVKYVPERGREFIRALTPGAKPCRDAHAACL